MSMDVRLLLPVLGAEDLDCFAALPSESLLAGNNLPALAQRAKVVLVLLAKKDLIERFAQTVFGKFSGYCELEFVALDDSGPPFDDKYMPPCMQAKWRAAWGFDAAFPPDCAECKQADGAGLLHFADFLMKKHPNGTIGVISSVQDEVIRLFYSVGLQDCASYDTANPIGIVVFQTDPTIYFSAQQYTDGLTDLRTRYMATSRFATYYMGGANISYHQHLFRSRFYDAAAGNQTIAAWVTDFLGGKITQVGP